MSTFLPSRYRPCDSFPVRGNQMRQNQRTHPYKSVDTRRFLPLHTLCSDVTKIFLFNFISAALPSLWHFCFARRAERFYSPHCFPTFWAGITDFPVCVLIYTPWTALMRRPFNRRHIITIHLTFVEIWVDIIPVAILNQLSFLWFAEYLPLIISTKQLL